VVALASVPLTVAAEEPLNPGGIWISDILGFRHAIIEALATLLEFNPCDIPAHTICRELLTSLQAVAHAADQR
jgi:hypothetical protein